MNDVTNNKEVLFESNYIRTPELVKEMFSLFYSKRPLKIVLNILCILLFIDGAFLLIFQGFDLLSLLSIIVPIYFFLITDLRYSRAKKIQIARDLEQNGGKYAEGTVFITEDGISHTTASGANTDIKLSSIKKAVKSKNHTFILTKSKLVYALSNNFTKGSPEELLDFLRNKNIKCK